MTDINIDSGDKELRKQNNSCSRTRKLYFNTVGALAYRLVMVVSGFILPRFFLVAYGSNINGLVNSISSFLGFIALADLGVSSVVESSFYGPLAKNQRKETSEIWKSSSRFFRVIAIVLLLYVAILCGVYPMIVKSSYSYLYIDLLFLAICIGTFAQYFLGITNSLLLHADQRGYIVYIIDSIAIILNTIISCALIYLGLQIHLVKLVSSIIFLGKPILYQVYVSTHYNLDKNIKFDGEPIKQKWNGFAQHISAVVLDKTDIIVLTVFSTLENVSIYGVYNLVVTGVRDIVQTSASGIQALFGNLLANNEMEKLKDFFAVTEWGIHTATTFVFTITGILIMPFINVYTRGIHDANYIVPLFAVLITLAQAVRSLKLPYNLMVLAAGHYKQTQTSSFIEAGLNILISIIAVFKLGLVGVAMGTLMGMAYRTFYLAWYLSKNIINRNISNFIKHILIDILSVFVIFFSINWLVYSPNGYIAWIILAIKVSVIGLGVCILLNLIFYRKEMIHLLMYVKKRKKSA